MVFLTKCAQLSGILCRKLLTSCSRCCFLVLPECGDLIYSLYLLNYLTSDFLTSDRPFPDPNCSFARILVEFKKHSSGRKLSLFKKNSPSNESGLGLPDTVLSPYLYMFNFRRSMSFRKGLLIHDLVTGTQMQVAEVLVIPIYTLLLICLSGYS